MSAAHTPGPWKMDPSFSAEIITVNGLKIASVWSEEDLGASITVDRECVPDDQYPANAALIAAAPDLLAALRLVERGMRQWSIDDHAPEWKAIYDAIAKAEARP